MTAAAQNPLPVSSLPGVSGLRGRSRGDYWFFHLSLPLLVYATAMLWARGFHGDFQLADRLYAWEGHVWASHSALLENWLHIGVRRLSTLAWWLVLLGWALAWRRPRWAEWKRPLGYLALSIALSAGLVSWIKSHSGMQCPWDLFRYGGTQAYHGFAGANFGHAGCFPAGHASGGYAWLALYFCFMAVRPQWRWAGLAIGVGAGLLCGLTQQLRGAHFVSHDLTTALICWLVALSLNSALLRKGAGAGP